MFDGFERTAITTPEAAIAARIGGDGPPVLLLHGHPQTHVMWHHIAPQLARDFTVVATDLRGYGDSSKPSPDPAHETYSKRAMARDQVAAMAALGFDRFHVVGHDRGARVGYRLALDHPGVVERLAVLDILPTGEHLARADASFALGYWHWFFYAQPADLPERFLHQELESGRFAIGRRDRWSPAAYAEYLRCYAAPGTIEAICEDYRAGQTVDREHDDADQAAGRRIDAPVLALWGADGSLPGWYDVLEVWRGWADEVSGAAIPGGHHFPEHSPDEVVDHLRRFLGVCTP